MMKVLIYKYPDSSVCIFIMTHFGFVPCMWFDSWNDWINFRNGVESFTVEYGETKPKDVPDVFLRAFESE